MTTFWSEHDCDTMRTLWAQGMNSRDISLKLSCSPTRNAVMGKLNRLGLMGLGKPLPVRLETMDKVSRILDEPFFMGKPLHREALLTLLFDHTNGSVKSLSELSGVSRDFCEAFLARLPLVWPKGEPMPSRWCNGLEGKFAFIIDMAIIHGNFDKVCQDNRPPVSEVSDQIAA